MEAKVFELRDRGTFVVVVAMRIEPKNEAELYLLRRSGYQMPCNLILMGGVGNTADDRITYDPYYWGNNGTRLTAHQYIQEHWDELEPGAVICTEFIRGERQTPKISERLE